MAHSFPSLPMEAFQLRRLQAEPGELGEARKTLRITGPGGRVLYEWNSPLGTISAIWNGRTAYLAVNDVPGRQGDQLRVFALDAAKQCVIPLHEPDGVTVRAEVEPRHGGFFSTVDKVIIRCVEWKEGRLWCQVTGTFATKRQRGIHVPFHYLWVFRVSGEDPPAFEEKWVRTFSMELTVRDPLL